jgi:hypothetical protein
MIEFLFWCTAAFFAFVGVMNIYIKHKDQQALRREGEPDWDSPFGY